MDFPNSGFHGGIKSKNFPKTTGKCLFSQKFKFLHNQNTKIFQNKFFRVIAIDMRGYGESEKKKKVKSYEMHLLVEDINNFIKALDVKKFTIVAHDWGGVVGHYYIRTYPEKLNKYILLNTAYSRTFNKSIMKSWKQFKKSFYIFVLRVRDVPEYLMALDDFFIFDIMLQKLASPEEIEAYKYTYRNYGEFPINYPLKIFFFNPKIIFLHQNNAMDLLITTELILPPMKIQVKI